MTDTRFDITQRTRYETGRTNLPEYERIDGIVHFEIDPTAAENAGIVDLELAPRNADGRIVTRSAFVAVQPVDAKSGNGRVLLDVPNRGRCLSLIQFNRAPRDQADAIAFDPGDGFLFERGYSVVSVGWQWDIAHDQGIWHDAPIAGPQPGSDGTPIEGQVVCHLLANSPAQSLHFGQLGAVPYPPADPADPRAQLIERATGRVVPHDQWRFARQTRDGVRTSNSNVYLDAGFEPGVGYQLIYYAAYPRVTGTGMLAIRDFALALSGTDNPLGRPFERVYGFGASQTGRFLRHFVYETRNTGAGGRSAFDGLVVHIAGGQRGDFNHRFAQPSALGAPSYGQTFPFAAAVTDDPHSGHPDGLFPDGAPKTMFTNTSWEYWRGDAALIHADAVSGTDIVEHPDTRCYLLTGAQHTNGSLPQTREQPLLGIVARHDFSVVDFRRCCAPFWSIWTRG